MGAGIPDNESERLSVLDRYDVLDTAAEPAFDRLTRTAARVLNVKSAMLSFVDRDREFLKSSYGVELRDIPREVAFCAHAILSDGPLVIPDTRLDSRFADNPLVTGAPGIRYYVGLPLKTRDGFHLGALCVVDTAPHSSPSGRELVILEDLAAEVVEQLEFRLAKRHLSLFEEILERREKELKEHEARRSASDYRAELALEAGHLGSWEWEVPTGRVVWSPIMEQLFGFAPGTYEASYKQWLAKVHPEDRDGLVGAIEQLQPIRTSFQQRYRIIRENGEVRWIAGKGTCQHDEEGQLVRVIGVCSDITEEEIAGRELRGSEELFRGLSFSCPVGIFQADLYGNATYVNPQTAQIWGTPEADMLGREWLKRVHPDDADSLIQGWIKANALGQEFEHEYRLLFPDNSLRWIHGRSAVIYDRSGRPVATVGTVDDVTERKKTEHELFQAKESAEAANRTKNLFLANVSHELRTPLNGVLGMVDLLLDTSLEPDQREFAETARDSGQALLSVVNDILDLSTIEAGKLKIESAPFDLRLTVSQAIAVVQAQAKAKGLVLTSDFPPSVPATFVGDSARLRQVLLNYLMNATKFTEHGRIWVEVRAECVSAEIFDVLLAVRDTGAGLSEQAQASLFRPFTQVDASSTRKHSGVGLGLAISKRIAELMGGEVGVISTLGEGSTFWIRVRLPVLPSRQDLCS